MTAWQQWLQHPEKSWVRHALFQIHLWVGAAVGVYVLLMSISGSIIVYRNELSGRFSVEWLVNLHENLLFGTTGRFGNGIGAICHRRFHLLPPGDIQEAFQPEYAIGLAAFPF